MPDVIDSCIPFLPNNARLQFAFAKAHELLPRMLSKENLGKEGEARYRSAAPANRMEPPVELNEHLGGGDPPQETSYGAICLWEASCTS
jgi:hypothetical protein